MLTPDDLVRREVIYCVSALVSTLASAAGGDDDSADGTRLQSLAYQAMELASPVPDYEIAAEEAGWRETDDTPVFLINYEPGTHIWVRKCNPDDGEFTPTGLFEANDAEDACYTDDLEPHELEVYEHWIVSDWLAEMLEARGEKVNRNFAGLTIWARTATGRSIAIDSVIVDICAALASAA